MFYSHNGQVILSYQQISTWLELLSSILIIRIKETFFDIDLRRLCQFTHKSKMNLTLTWLPRHITFCGVSECHIICDLWLLVRAYMRTLVFKLIKICGYSGKLCTKVKFDHIGYATLNNFRFIFWSPISSGHNNLRDSIFYMYCCHTHASWGWCLWLNC